MYLNESGIDKEKGKIIEEYLSLIKEKTNFDEVLETINELLIDIEDEVNNCTINKVDGIVNVFYKRENKRKNSLQLRDYKKTNYYGIRKADVINFLNYLEIATNISISYKTSFRINRPEENEEDLISLYKSFTNVYNTATSLGYNVIITYHLGGYDYDIDFFKKDFEEDPYNIKEFSAEFVFEIDPNTFKPNDPFLDLPPNVIEDFTTFANKLRFNNSNKIELLNILKKADWDKLSK